MASQPPDYFTIMSDESNVRYLRRLLYGSPDQLQPIVIGDRRHYENGYPNLVSTATIPNEPDAGHLQNAVFGTQHQPQPRAPHLINQTGNLHQPPQPERAPLPLDVWERWYVSISIGRTATDQDVINWRIHQANLEIRGEQDSTDYSAWQMVKATLQQQGHDNAGSSRQTVAWSDPRSVHTHAFPGPSIPNLRSSNPILADTNMQTTLSGLIPQAGSSHGQQPPRTEYSSYTTASNDNSRVQQYNITETLPAFQMTPSVEDEYLERQQQQTNEQLLQHRLRATETPTYHTNEPLNRMVRKREHARAVSNTTPPRVSGPQDLPGLAEPPEPPASAPPASPAYGVNPSREPPPPHLNLDRERRRAVGNPLAWRVASYSPRAARRRESNELAAAAAPPSPPSAPSSPPSPPPPQANGRWVYRYGEMQELMDYYKESTKRPGSHVSPVKRDGNKPWLTKNWREPRQDDQDGGNAL